VRAQMVDEPAAYPWSSYRANALGEQDPLVSPHGVYLALGASAPDRQAAYRDLCAAQVDPELLRTMRSCLQTGTPLGNDRFRAQVEQALGVRVGYSTRGRPRKPVTDGLADAGQIDLDLERGIGPDLRPLRRQ
jgi:putative transposase